MEPDAIDRILKVSRGMFYTDFLLLCCQLIAIGTILFFFRKEKMGYPFLIYCCAAFLLILIGRVRHFFYTQSESTTFLTEGTNIVFAIIEYSVFFHFFNKILRSSMAKKIMRLFYVLILTATIIFFSNVFFSHLSDSIILKISDYIISSELFFLALLCLTYYFELFHKKPIYNLLQSSSFWIVTSLFFLHYYNSFLYDSYR
jgi:hypothetical protein